MKTFSGRVLKSYFEDQVELYGNDIIEMPIVDGPSLQQKISLLHLCLNQNIFGKKWSLSLE